MGIPRSRPDSRSFGVSAGNFPGAPPLEFGVSAGNFAMAPREFAVRAGYSAWGISRGASGGQISSRLAHHFSRVASRIIPR